MARKRYSDYLETLSTFRRICTEVQNWAILTGAHFIILKWISLQLGIPFGSPTNHFDPLLIASLVAIVTLFAAFIGSTSYGIRGPRK